MKRVIKGSRLDDTNEIEVKGQSEESAYWFGRMQRETNFSHPTATVSANSNNFG